MIARNGGNPAEDARLVCLACGAAVSGDEASAAIVERDADPRCPSCGKAQLVERDPERTGAKAVARRWGEEEPLGFVATPNALLEHAVAVGLAAVDVFLLELLELHRRTGRPDEPAWPSDARLAALAGCSPGHVRKRLHGLRAAGLIEWELQRHGRHRAERRITRHGLTRVANLLLANRRTGLDDLAGLPELLVELRSSRRGPPLSSAPPGAELDVAPIPEARSSGPGFVSADGSSAPRGAEAPLLEARKLRSQRRTEAEEVEADTDSESSDEASNALKRVDGAPLVSGDEPW